MHPLAGAPHMRTPASNVQTKRFTRAQCWDRSMLPGHPLARASMIDPAARFVGQSFHGPKLCTNASPTPQLHKCVPTNIETERFFSNKVLVQIEIKVPQLRIRVSAGKAKRSNHQETRTVSCSKNCAIKTKKKLADSVSQLALPAPSP